jgi:3-oxoacyl-[acyl-carrier-protein] synthase III
MALSECGSAPLREGELDSAPEDGGRGRPYPVRIAGTGSYLPQSTVLSSELDAAYARQPGTTEARSGVRERRWAGSSESTSWMAARALDAACQQAGLPPGALDAVIVASVVPEQPMPTTGVLVLRELGLGRQGIETFDVNASCLGFLTSLKLAVLGIAARQWRAVGVVASEIASIGLNHADVESSALFGDGAGAAVLTSSPAGADSEVLALRFRTWAQGAALCGISAGGTRWNPIRPPADHSEYLFRMDGPGLLQLAARKLPRFLAEVLAEAGLRIEDLDVVIPHQVSEVGLRYLRERLGVPAAKVTDVLATRGNQVAASLPTALDAAVSSGMLHRGDRALLLGTAAGLSAGAAVIRY